MRGLKVYKLEKIKKSPNLIIGELKKNFNFECNRFFFITGKKNEIRGNHAHKKQVQFMICISGSCKLDFDDGYQKKTIFLKNNTVAVKVAGGIWGVQKNI